jgi:pimeloyl-ACP methyl ester carboxylesterase
MTVVLVNGNPEAEAIRGPLVDALGRKNVVCACHRRDSGRRRPMTSRRPTWFTATGWNAELAQVDEPIDLVGHDWGGGHA